MNDSEFDADVVVIGGGPGGASAAALLSTDGHDVLVLEREEFPRFKIGESLLPACLPVLQRLEIEPDPESFVFKRGAEFVCERTNRSSVFNFGEALDGPPRHAWQVDRAGFDRRLAERATELGARFRYGDKVLRVEFDDDAARVITRNGSFRARYVIDASGQNRLLARQLGTAEPILQFGKTAAFVHFDGLSDEALADIGEGSDIRIMMVEQGWGWIIPLPHRRLSVGIVSKNDVPATKLISDYIEGSPLIRKWTQGCTSSEPKGERNFSYRNRKPAGARFACVGDAACFLDPVFSSGVSLAMVSAQSVSDRLGPALREGREAEPSLMDAHSQWMDDGIRTFASMIDRFYNTHFIEHFIFGPAVAGVIQREIVSVLAGDVWRDDSGFAKMLQRSRRGPAVQTQSAIG